MADIETLLRSFIDLLDVMVELYLASVLKPFLLIHQEFSSNLNDFFIKILAENKKNIPEWFTATTVAYSRAILVIPTITLMACGQVVMPAILVLFVNFVGFLDAKFWADIKMAREEDTTKNDEGPDSRSPTPSDDDSYEYEVVTTGSPQRMNSWSLNHRSRTYGSFVSAFCDKAFTVPCWIYLLSTVPTTQFRSVQYVSLWWLIVTETTSGCVRCKSFFAAGGLPTPQVEGIELSKSYVQARHIAAVRQTLEMLGTALFLLPYLRYVGMLFLALACPLAYESIRRTLKKRVVYVIMNNNPTAKNQPLDHKVIKFLMQARALGSQLIVGVNTGSNRNSGGAASDMIANACSTACVDEVIAEAPAKADLMFLEKQGIDYVVFSAGQKGALVTDEVIAAGVCLIIGDDHIARPLRPKDESKQE